MALLKDALQTNIDLGALATLAAQGAVSTNTADQTNRRAKGIVCVIDITVAGGTPTLTVTVQGKDAGSGKYYTLVASTALAATGTTVLTVYPGMTAAANSVVSNVVPENWRIAYVVAGVSPAVTATISAILIP